MAAVIAPRDGKAPTLEELIAHCQPRLARYKLPRLVVSVPEVVRSPSGKPNYAWAKRVAMGDSQPSPAPAGSSANT